MYIFCVLHIFCIVEINVEYSGSIHTIHSTMGVWWRWALLSPDGVVPSWMVCVSASVNLPLHHKVQKFSSGTVSPGWSRKKGHNTAVVVLVYILCTFV